MRTQREREGFVDSSFMQVGSSSPIAPSSSQGSNLAYVQEANDLPEQATVQIASSFIRHVLWTCPPQSDTRQHKPEYLVEFSAILRQLKGTMGNGGVIRATADGEMRRQIQDRKPDMSTRRQGLEKTAGARSNLFNPIKNAGWSHTGGVMAR